MLEEVVKLAKEKDASDVHFVYGLPIRIRVDGLLQNLNDVVLNDSDLKGFVKEADPTFDFEKDLQKDLAITLDGTRCRLNIFRQQDHFSIALRVLRNVIPNLADLRLPPVISSLSKFNSGIVLITGETGSGKSTTLAALLNEINNERYEHIITLEDPIEYIYTSNKCIVNQREVGKDVKSYEDGLHAILREDPDIILVGEMRSLETIEAALTAAETGHLVFATLHTNSASDTIDRIVNSFPAEKKQQVRMQLSTCLKAVVSQTLLPKKEGRGRVCATEIMIVNSAIKNLIREGDTPSIHSTIQTTAQDGNMTMDSCLINMTKMGLIEDKVAVDAASDMEYVKEVLHYTEKKVNTNRTFFD